MQSVIKCDESLVPVFCCPTVLRSRTIQNPRINVSPDLRNYLRLSGDLYGLSGDAYGVTGNGSLVVGDLTGIAGNLTGLCGGVEELVSSGALERVFG